MSSTPSTTTPTPTVSSSLFPLRWLLWFFLPVAAVCYRTLLEALSLGWEDSRYNYAAVALVVGLVLLYQERDFLFPGGLQALPEPRREGAILAVVAVALNLVLTYAVDGVDLFWRFLPLPLAWIGGLWYLYGGWPTVREAGFQSLMLLAAAPVPESWMHSFEMFLQYASADVSDAIFRLIGSTVYREGLMFSLPGLNIEVARECSGIRSTTALILVVAVCGHLMLRKGWTQAAFLLLAVPAGILKNAVRIVILAWLGANVSPDILNGPLHKQGGPLFTLTAVAVLAPALWWLMRLEKKQAKAESRGGSPASAVEAA